MKTPPYPILAFLALGILGWFLADGLISSRSERVGRSEQDTSRPQRPPTAAAGSSSQPALHPWSGPALPYEEFVGIHQIEHGSTVLRLADFITPREQATFQPRNLSDLARWLELTPSEVARLHDILHRAAADCLRWEKEVMSAERVSPRHYRIAWREAEPSRLQSLRELLLSTFGETLARSIWIRGGLDRFFEHPLLETEDGSRGTLTQLEIILIPPSRQDGTASLRVSPYGSVPPRLAHLIPSPEMEREMGELSPSAPAASQYPVAERAPGVPHFVVSPYNGKILDVTGLQPGSLVRDPSFTPSEGESGIFRIPEDLAEE